MSFRTTRHQPVSSKSAAFTRRGSFASTSSRTASSLMRGCSPCSSRRRKMAWRVGERKVGRAGGVKQRTARLREWDQKYGKGNWAVGYVIDGTFVLQEDALDIVDPENWTTN